MTAIQRSTAGFLKASVDSIRELQAEYAETANQVSSGRKGKSFAAPGLNVTSFLYNYAASDRLDVSIDTAKAQNARITDVENRIGSIIELLSDLQRNLIGCHDATMFADQKIPIIADRALEGVVNFLNDRYNGEALLSGTTLDIDPIDLTQLDTTPDAHRTDFKYYMGNTQKYSIKLNGSPEIIVSFNANDPAVEKVIRGIRLIGTIPPDASTDAEIRTKLNDAQTLIGQGLNDLISFRSNVSLTAKQVEAYTSSAEDRKFEFDTFVQEELAADPTESMMAIVQLQIQLQAMFEINRQALDIIHEAFKN